MPGEPEVEEMMADFKQAACKAVSRLPLDSIIVPENKESWACSRVP